MKKICVFQDTETIRRTADLIEAARRMYGPGRFESHAVVMENSLDGLTGSFHRITLLPRGLVNLYNPRGICDILEDLHQKNRFDSILIPATSPGKMIAARLAKRLETGLVSNVTDIIENENGIEIIRPACCGKIMQVIRHKGRGPVIMSIKPNIFDYGSKGHLATNVSEYTGRVTSICSVKRLDVEKNIRTCDIRDSRVLIAGGGGAKDCFESLYPLAEALNAKVAASRKLVDLGIAPRNIQVGQSGKTVSPELYMAIGIHGTMQHIAGLRDIEYIISINKDSKAPVCSMSDIVVKGDAVEFTDKLMKKISTHRSAKKEEPI